MTIEVTEEIHPEACSRCRMINCECDAFLDKGIVLNNSFDEFIAALKKIRICLFPDANINDYDLHEYEDIEHIGFTFFLSEEEQVDIFIRRVRDELLLSPRFSEVSETNCAQFIYQLCKSHIQSHDYWSVDFSLANRYGFLEDSQP